MAEFDLVIRGGTVVDGTGIPRINADVGIKDGRIAMISGRINGAGAKELDASGCIVAPGAIDLHTHYDAQLFWDPVASPSNLHGVTSVVMGNCGFTLAPLGDASDADYLGAMMVQVEGMSPAALELGVDWQWRSFADYLDRLDGKVGVNVAAMVGHCALRRTVMKDDAVTREATDDEMEEMKKLRHVLSSMS